MALINAIAQSIKNHAQNIEDAFGLRDITSSRMLEAIAAWYSIYLGLGTGSCENVAQSIPYIIIDGLTKATFGEYKYSTDTQLPEDDLFMSALDALDRVRERAFQGALIGGEGFIKPVIHNGTFQFLYINRNNFKVFGRDVEGNITDIGTLETTVYNGKYYTLAERRTVDSNGYLTIENRLYVSSTPDTLGQRTTLSTLDKYKDLEERVRFLEPIGNLGLGYIKTPMANCVDGSLDGVSVYAAAVDKILQAYGLDSRSESEYELTEPHVIASADLQRRDSQGRLLEIPKYITPLLDDETADVGLTVYNPKPNQIELEARENQLARQIENIIGLRRGMLSHVETDDRTATAVVTSSGRYALTIKDLQSMWEKTVRETIALCGVLGKLLLNWPAAEGPEPVIEWGNGVLYDEEAEFNRLNSLVAGGNLKGEYLIGWQFDLPTETEEDLRKIRERYMPDITAADDVE